jgi:hypothetical protein
VLAGVSVSVIPVTATVTASHRITLAVSVSGAASQLVNWTVNDIADGNSTFGQICVVNISPCSQVTASTSAQMDYLAPGSLPSPNPVTVQVASASDATKYATSQITVINHDVVSVLPNSITLAPGAIQKFTASVLGTTDQSVFWHLRGSSYSVTDACGSIASDGTYTAPGSAPSLNTLQVVAISSDDTSQSASAAVTISSPANIQLIHLASVYAGGANGSRRSFCSPEILRPRIDPDSRTGPLPGLQSFRGLERHNVSLRSRAWHFRDTAPHRFAT